MDYNDNNGNYNSNNGFDNNGPDNSSGAHQPLDCSSEPAGNPTGQYVWRENLERPTTSYNAEFGTAAATKQKKSMPGWLKVILIIAAVVICFAILSASCSRAVNNILGTQAVSDDYTYYEDYIGVLYLDGTISTGNSGDGYNHKWMLNRVSQMEDDEYNKGIVMYINTPGGSAFATAELYKALLEYKDETNRPIYVYMANQATSGGYYAAMAADKIYANEECWTGSIGVIISGIYDFSELMEKYGVHAENITSGKNKDMGTSYKPLTDEQREIYQGLVDDTFDRFVAAVAKGRGMSETKVRELADGRVYTATQAVKNGLIDEIGTLDETIKALRDENDLKGVSYHTIQYVEKEDLLSYLGLDGVADYGKSDLSIIKDILEESETIEIQCITPWIK